MSITEAIKPPPTKKVSQGIDVSQSMTSREIIFGGAELYLVFRIVNDKVYFNLCELYFELAHVNCVKHWVK